MAVVTAPAAAVATTAEGWRQVMAPAASCLQLTYSTQWAVGVDEHVTHSPLCAVARVLYSARQQAAGGGHTSSPPAVSGAWARPAPPRCESPTRGLAGHQHFHCCCQTSSCLTDMQLSRRLTASPVNPFAPHILFCNKWHLQHARIACSLKLLPLSPNALATLLPTGGCARCKAAAQVGPARHLCVRRPTQP